MVLLKVIRTDQFLTPLDFNRILAKPEGKISICLQPSGCVVKSNTDRSVSHTLRYYNHLKLFDICLDHVDLPLNQR